MSVKIGSTRTPRRRNQLSARRRKPTTVTLRSSGKTSAYATRELDGLLTAVQEFARAARVATPQLDAITALVIEKARRMGLYPLHG